MIDIDFDELPVPPVPESAVSTKWKEAALYCPDARLKEALSLAAFLGQPLLLTGRPGCGKTSAAYWAAWRMGLEETDLVHAQVRSDETAAGLKYEFDAVRYLGDSQVAAHRGQDWSPHFERYCRKGPLWRAFEAVRRNRTVVLLLDEIDKAPRDLPNDLLHEFDQMDFEVPEWRDTYDRPVRISGRPEEGPIRLLMVLTSNGERDLPEPFLRRCIHHHIEWDAEWLESIVRFRSQKAAQPVSDELIRYAVQRFMDLQRVDGLTHVPGPSEFLVWMRMIVLRARIEEPDRLQHLRLADLPYLGTLIKDPGDIHAIRKSGR